MTSLQPLPGFNWQLVTWGGPDELMSEICSYCDEPLHEDEVPLCLFNDDGWAARFCEHCSALHFGLQRFPEPPEVDE